MPTGAEDSAHRGEGLQRLEMLARDDGCEVA